MENHTNWFWFNGMLVDDTNYPRSEQSVCEQMSIPLTYDDGISLLPKRCDREAYYACDIPRKYTVNFFRLIASSENNV